MFIPVYVEGNTVGKLSGWWECVIVAEKKNLFPKSLIGATIQDGGTRERKGHLMAVFCLSIYYWKWNCIQTWVGPLPGWLGHFGVIWNKLL